MLQKLLVATFLIIVASYTTSSKLKSASEITKNMGDYSIKVLRNGCKLSSGTIHSSKSIPEGLYGQFMISSDDGKIVGYFGIECEQVRAGANSECSIKDYNTVPLEKLAGPGCSAWSNFGFAGTSGAPIAEESEPAPPLPRHRPSSNS